LTIQRHQRKGEKIKEETSGSPFNTTTMESYTVVMISAEETGQKDNGKLRILSVLRHYGNPTFIKR
jgi:hypothetical protein